MRWASALVPAAPVAAAVAAAAWLVATASGPERREQVERAVPVTVARVAAEAPAPVARGLGTARPAQRWRAVAEVGGQVVWRHPDLAGGNMLAAGTKVLEIDPADHRLAVAQPEADLAALEAERAQLEVEAENTRAVLALERDALALAERDLERVRRLVAQGAAPATRADEQERAALQARRVVQELENALALVPSRQARLAAQAERARAQLERARRDLASTVITAPFDLRVDEVLAERFQSVAAGQVLVTGDDVETAEVVAQVPLDAFRRLAGGVFAAAGQTGIEAMRAEALESVSAEARLAADPRVRWPARVARVEGGLDPRTRSVGVVVAVDAPYAGAAPPDRLPLVRDMYVEVVLAGPPLPPRVAVPEGAVHEGFVYVLGPDSRLELRPVVVAFHQDGLAWLDEGLEPGESVVLDDVVPAISGMLLDPVEARP